MTNTQSSSRTSTRSTTEDGRRSEPSAAPRGRKPRGSSSTARGGRSQPSQPTTTAPPDSTMAPEWPLPVHGDASRVPSIPIPPGTPRVQASDSSTSPTGHSSLNAALSGLYGTVAPQPTSASSPTDGGSTTIRVISPATCKHLFQTKSSEKPAIETQSTSAETTTTATHESTPRRSAKDGHPQGLSSHLHQMEGSKTPTRLRELPSDLR